MAPTAARERPLDIEQRTQSDCLLSILTFRSFTVSISAVFYMHSIQSLHLQVSRNSLIIGRYSLGE
eukprot:scaffold196021_cov18-Prasinocladus_malaysianus.AAC.1